MSARFFLDTNILVYSFDPTAPKKRVIAQSLIREALSDQIGCISTQVVQEFLNVLTKKSLFPMTFSDRMEYLKEVLSPLCLVFPSMALLEQASKIQEETGYHFYDSLIIAGAIEGQCKVLYSEDLQHNRKLRGITIQNPFR